MTSFVDSTDFALEPALEAHEPPEARGRRRDQVRLLVGRRGPGVVSHHRFPELVELLEPGDVLVVNTSPTRPAAIDLDAGLALHVSTELPGGSDWVVELRQRHGGRATSPYRGGAAGQRLALPGGAGAVLLRPYSARLWVARFDVDVGPYLAGHGHPIRYGYVHRDWPLSAYQTVFATDSSTVGSAEMPSAGRPFTTELVTRLVSAGVTIAPIALHTGVASPEAHEPPYPERYEVPAATARLVNSARAAGSRVVAVGTTAVRALESAVTPAGRVAAAAGWTDLVVTPGRGVRVVDGLLTGLHEPRASHLSMLAAIAGPDLLDACYAQALAGRYLWHEFGDVNLLLP